MEHPEPGHPPWPSKYTLVTEEDGPILGVQRIGSPEAWERRWLSTLSLPLGGGGGTGGGSKRNEVGGREDKERIVQLGGS